MAYITEAEIRSAIGAETLLKALDQDRDGVADPGEFERLEALAARRVNARLTGVVTLPITGTVPDAVADAALAVLCDMCERLAGLSGERNVHAAEARNALELLDRIREGKASLETPTEEPTPDESDWTLEKLDNL